MQPKTILLALVAGASASAIEKRQTVEQNLAIKNFTINAITGKATTLYQLSVSRGPETALCSIKEAQPNQAENCYDTPAIEGFSTLGCGSTHFDWSFTSTSSGYLLQIDVQTDDTPPQVLTACHSIPSSQFQCRSSQSRKYVGPRDFNVTAAVGNKCT